MKCMYYLAPTLEEAREIAGYLKKILSGQLYVVGNDEERIERENLPSGNYLETRDIVRCAMIGIGAGLIGGPVIALILFYFRAFGPGVPDTAYYILAAVVVLFGAWEGGLTGIAKVNRKLSDLRERVGFDRYLILVYARHSQERLITECMRNRYPATRLVAVDPHFLNPFMPVQPAADDAEQMQAGTREPIPVTPDSTARRQTGKWMQS